MRDPLRCGRFGDTDEEIGDYFSQWGLVTMVQKVQDKEGKDKGSRAEGVFHYMWCIQGNFQLDSVQEGVLVFFYGSP